jgi:4-hydroxythreonine-4-phosphate dehydrogenase
MKQKPLIVITMGDPSGIGPEIIAKVMDSGEIDNLCRPVVVGDAGVMRKVVAELQLAVTVHSIVSLRVEAETVKSGMVVFDMENVDLSKHKWGRPNVASGRSSVEYIKKAVDMCLKGEAAAIVTAPINKEMINAAGHHYAGHTELLADLTGSKEFGMMFVGGGLRVILATIHVALRDVAGQITTASILKTLRLAHRAMRYFGIERPRIGVAALNPHASEGGLFGNEEWEEMVPAVIQARDEGIDASDPVPDDTLFYKARNNHYDIVVAMYHDQGLAPLKMLAFGNAVNVTVGLPIIRTSVDHGTAYDIAGKGCADPASLFEAVKLAAEMTEFRNTESAERA